MRSTAVAVFSVLFVVGIILYFGASFGNGRPSVLFEREDGEIAEEENVNVLVLGRVAEGQGGKWHLAPGLVDAIILLHYRPETNVVNLISLPRDLYGTFAEYPYKLNEIYHRKEVESFLEKLSDITGISANKFAVVDIDIIEKVVDELGGVDVEIASAVIDPVSGFKLDAGTQHLSGEDASWLIRNRNAPQGDFFREANQHLIIKALFEKFKLLSQEEKTKFYFQMIPELKLVETNFSIGEFVPQFGNIGNLRFNSIVLDFTTGLLRSSYISDGVITTSTATSTGSTTPAYVLIPGGGIDNYTAIREFISDRIE